MQCHLLIGLRLQFDGQNIHVPLQGLDSQQHDKDNHAKSCAGGVIVLVAAVISEYINTYGKCHKQETESFRRQMQFLLTGSGAFNQLYPYVEGYFGNGQYENTDMCNQQAVFKIFNTEKKKKIAQNKIDDRNRCDFSGHFCNIGVFAAEKICNSEHFHKNDGFITENTERFNIAAKELRNLGVNDTADRHEQRDQRKVEQAVILMFSRKT